jgi:hypothetical protein
MKMSVKFISVSLTLLCILVSCDFIKDIFPNPKSRLTFKASISNSTNLSDTILFTGGDIICVNGTTGEIRFVDSMTIPKISNYHWIKCFLGTDSLFKATVTAPTMSTIINDLVLELNRDDGHFYFKDGYPSYIDNPGINIIRVQNKEKRAVAWCRFINQLKKEGRYVEK